MSCASTTPCWNAPRGGSACAPSRHDGRDQADGARWQRARAALRRLRAHRRVAGRGRGPGRRGHLRRGRGRRAYIVPPSRDLPAPDTAAFAELVRLRAAGGIADPEAELALLTEGVVRARPDGGGCARDGAGGSGAQRQGGCRRRRRGGQRLPARAGRWSRPCRAHRCVARRGALSPRNRSPGQRGRGRPSRRRADRGRGLSPRPAGMLRSTTWFRRMAQA